MKKTRKPAPRLPDGGEQIALMEPMLISEGAKQRIELTDLAVDLAARASGFRRSLPEGLVAPLADLVRAMNCYYSNLIEGHNTHPIDIERALNDDLDKNPEKRDLQLEAKAHIVVQRWVDQGGLKGRATTVEGIRETHKRFIERLPSDLQSIDGPKAKVQIVPGALRDRRVEVGRHQPVSPGALPRFLARFEQVYTRLSKAETIIAAAAAHHRLLWIHPFIDGNGRVARLMSHATLLETLDTGAIWSVARGLARNVGAYKSHLAACDTPRRNDLDGRGHLSEEELADFTNFFLKTCIDQIGFMENLMQPERLRARILSWVDEEIRMDELLPQAGRILEAILYRGELPRGDVLAVLGLKERQAQRVANQLHGHGIIVSQSSRAPWRLAFPMKLAPRLMPGLYPERNP